MKSSQLHVLPERSTHDYNLRPNIHCVSEMIAKTYYLNLFIYLFHFIRHSFRHFYSYL